MAIEQYRQYIRHLLSERRYRASILPNAEEYEVQTLFDGEQDHYQLLFVLFPRHQPQNRDRHLFNK